MTAEKPFYGESAPFYDDSIGGGFKDIANDLQERDGDWMSLDIVWLTTRTSYAIVVRTPVNSRGKHPDNFWLSWSTLNRSTGFYDCVRGMSLDPYSNNDNSFDAIYHCGEALVGDLRSGWDRDIYTLGRLGNLEDQISLMRGRYIAVMAIITPESSLPTSHWQAKPGEVSPDGKVLHNAYRAALMDRTQSSYMASATLRKICQRWMESHMRFITPYLLENSDQFFECTSTVVLQQSEFIGLTLYYRREIERHCSAWMSGTLFDTPQLQSTVTQLIPVRHVTTVDSDPH